MLAIPKKVRDHLLVEAQHRCSICSERCFEIHHIEEKAEGGADDEGNLIVMCPNCHQHRYHRSGEFTRDQLRIYKSQLKERTEIERRLLQNLEDVRDGLRERKADELLTTLAQELDNASRLIDPERSPRLARSVEETAREMAESSILPEVARKAIELKFEIERARAKSQFPTIVVVGADDQAYRKDSKFPKAYEFVLKLNSAPASDWCRVFDRMYHESWYNMKRETRISSDRAIMIVGESDNLQRHVEWLKALVSSTNEWVQTRGFGEIDMEINRELTKSLEEFDAIQSMKEQTMGIKF